VKASPGVIFIATRKFGRSAGGDDAAAREDNRPLGVFNHFRGFSICAGVPTIVDCNSVRTLSDTRNCQGSARNVAGTSMSTAGPSGEHIKRLLSSRDIPVPLLKQSCASVTDDNAIDSPPETHR